MFNAMPHDFNNGYWDVRNKPVIMNTIDAIDYLSGSIWNENTQRTRHFLNRPIPEQPDYIQAMIEASRSQRDRRQAQRRNGTGDKKLVTRKSKWFNAMRDDKRRKKSA